MQQIHVQKRHSLCILNRTSRKTIPCRELPDKQHARSLAVNGPFAALSFAASLCWHCSCLCRPCTFIRWAAILTSAPSASPCTRQHRQPHPLLWSSLHMLPRRFSRWFSSLRLAAGTTRSTTDPRQSSPENTPASRLAAQPRCFCSRLRSTPRTAVDRAAKPFVDSWSRCSSYPRSVSQCSDPPSP